MTMALKARNHRISSKSSTRSNRTKSLNKEQFELRAEDVHLERLIDTSYSTLSERSVCRCEQTLPTGITSHYSGGIEFQLCVCHVDS